MRTCILLLCIIIMTGCVNSMKDLSTFAPVDSSSSPVRINGTWEGGFKMPGGRRKVSFEFNKNEDTLIGAVLW